MSNPIAIVKIKGKQYLLREGDFLTIDKLNTKAKRKLSFNQVLLFSQLDGREIKIGQPYLVGSEVKVKILEEKKGPKITIVKYRPKTRYRRKRGFRPTYTKIKIEKIIV